MKPSMTFAIDAEPQLPVQLKSIAGTLLGWGIVAIVPAVFWAFVCSFIGPLVGVSISTGGLMVIAGSIALFLTLVYVAVANGGTPEH